MMRITLTMAHASNTNATSTTMHAQLAGMEHSGTFPPTAPTSNVDRHAQVRREQAARARQRRVAALLKKGNTRVKAASKGLGMAQGVSRQEETPLTNNEVEGGGQQVADMPLAGTSASRPWAHDDMEAEELARIDYVSLWLQKHCPLDEEDWRAVMLGYDATPEVMAFEGMVPPPAPSSMYVLHGADHTTLRNTFPGGTAQAARRLTALEESHKAILARLAFPSRMVMQHVCYIVKAFLRRVYLRLEHATEERRSAVMGSLHRTLQAIIHRYFERGLHRRVDLEEAADRRMFGGSDDEGDSDNSEERRPRKREKHEHQEKANKAAARKEAQQLLQRLCAGYEHDEDGLLSTLEDIHNGRKTMEEALKEVEGVERNPDTPKDTTNKDSKNEDDDPEEFYIPDDNSHASLEFSDSERKFCHLYDGREKCEARAHDSDEESCTSSENDYSSVTSDVSSEGTDSEEEQEPKVTRKRKRSLSPEEIIDIDSIARITAEFIDEDEERRGWQVARTEMQHKQWMEEVTDDKPKRIKLYSRKHQRAVAARYRRMTASRHSSVKRETMLAEFMQRGVSRRIHRYIMKTVCRRNFVLCRQLWRRAKGLKNLPGLTLETENPAVLTSLKRQKEFLTDLFMSEREALLYRLSRKYNVSCEDILRARAALPVIRERRRFTTQVVKFLNKFPIRRLEYLHEHVLSKKAKERKGESERYADRTSLMMFLETLARLHGKEQACPWVTPAEDCSKQRGYVEGLVRSIEEDYTVCLERREKRARRQKMAEKIKNLNAEKKRTCLLAAKTTYQQLTRMFLGREYRHREEAHKRKKILSKMHRFLSTASPDDIIMKVYDIQTEDREDVKRTMLLGDEEVILEIDDANPEDWAWLEDEYPEDEEYLRREEERDRKAAEEREARMESLSTGKVFRELHLQYFGKANDIPKKDKAKEAAPPSLPFQDQPWDTSKYRARLDKRVRLLSNSGSEAHTRLDIDFQREIRRLWHYKPKGFLKTIRRYEKLRQTYITEQNMAWLNSAGGVVNETEEHHKGDSRLTRQTDGHEEAGNVSEVVVSKKRKHKEGAKASQHPKEKRGRLV